MKRRTFLKTAATAAPATFSRPNVRPSQGSVVPSSLVSFISTVKGAKP